MHSAAVAESEVKHTDWYACRFTWVHAPRLAQTSHFSGYIQRRQDGPRAREVCTLAEKPSALRLFHSHSSFSPFRQWASRHFISRSRACEDGEDLGRSERAGALAQRPSRAAPTRQEWWRERHTSCNCGRSACALSKPKLTLINDAVNECLRFDRLSNRSLYY